LRVTENGVAAGTKLSGWATARACHSRVGYRTAVHKHPELGWVAYLV
jgi:hypothetical protein